MIHNADETGIGTEHSSPKFVCSKDMKAVHRITKVNKYKTMFGTSLRPVVCRRAHVLFTLFVFAYV
jgi:hypothetical protein